MTLAAVCGDGKFTGKVSSFTIIYLLFEWCSMSQHVYLATIFFRFAKKPGGATLRDSKRIPTHFAGEIPTKIPIDPLYPQ